MSKTRRTIDLELKPARFKNFAEADIKTITGKHNRVAIGQPRCTREDPFVAATLLTAADKVAYPADGHRFYRISFDVTLYPDEGCRFRSADLVVILQPDPGRKKLPLILHLNPHERGTKMAVKIKSDEKRKLKLSPPVFKFLSASLGTRRHLRSGTRGSKRRFPRSEPGQGRLGGSSSPLRAPPSRYALRPLNCSLSWPRTAWGRRGSGLPPKLTSVRRWIGG